MKEPGQLAREAYLNSMLRHMVTNDPNPQDPLEAWAAVERAVLEEAAKVAEQYEPRCETDAIAAAIRALAKGDPK